jgi:hypothetical protein
MKEKLMTDIREAVAANLTGMVGDELLKLIDEHKLFQQSNNDLQDQLDELIRTSNNNWDMVEELKSKLENEDEFNAKVEQFNADYKKFESDKFKFEIEKENIILKTRLSEREKFDDRVDQFYAIPFKNRQLRESVMIPTKMPDILTTEYQPSGAYKNTYGDGGEALSAAYNTKEEE